MTLNRFKTLRVSHMNQTLHTFLHLYRPIYEFNTATAVKPVVSTHIHVHTPSPSIHLLLSVHILFLTPSIHLLSLCSFATLLSLPLHITDSSIYLPSFPSLSFQCLPFSRFIFCSLHSSTLPLSLCQVLY